MHVLYILCFLRNFSVSVLRAKNIRTAALDFNTENDVNWENTRPSAYWTSKCIPGVPERGSRISIGTLPFS